METRFGELRGDDELKGEALPHYLSYPRCPKINSYIETCNRTMQGVYR